jgi:hypothetical protein
LRCVSTAVAASAATAVKAATSFINTRQLFIQVFDPVL